MNGFGFSILLTIHILVGLGIIALVLLQHGKGADMGAAFGSGASGSLFGASGSANFLSRSTAALATVFFVTSLGLSFLAGSGQKAPSSIMQGVGESVPAAAQPAVPAAPADGDSKAGAIPK